MPPPLTVNSRRVVAEDGKTYEMPFLFSDCALGLKSPGDSFLTADLGLLDFEGRYTATQLCRMVHAVYDLEGIPWTVGARPVVYKDERTMEIWRKRGARLPASPEEIAMRESQRIGRLKPVKYQWDKLGVRETMQITGTPVQILHASFKSWCKPRGIVEAYIMCRTRRDGSGIVDVTRCK